MKFLFWIGLLFGLVSNLGAGMYVFAFNDYMKRYSYSVYHILDDRILDKDFRKKLVRDYFIKEIKEVEKCVADKHRIVSNENKITHREIVYNTDAPCGERDFGLREYIYHNKTIKDVYALRRPGFVESYRVDTLLSFINLIYPAKMPLKDYYPFTELDLRSQITMPLTAEEKKRRDTNNAYSIWDIDEFSWSHCVLWLDSHRLFMNLENRAYYFKQVDKDVHLFEILPKRVLRL